MASARIFGACRGALMAAAKGAASGRSTAAKTASPKARVNVGIQKVVPVSAQLRKFLGTSEASRTDAVKKVWEYIKLHNLQEYNAKFSDFGLAKDGPEGDRTHVSTLVMGTYGYAARVHNDSHQKMQMQSPLLMML